MKFKRLLLLPLLLFPLVGCNKAGDEAEDSEISNIYHSYQENGGKLSYSEWLEAIKGELGKDGKDGLTPYIGENGHWFIGETDTGYKAGSQENTDVESLVGNKYYSYDFNDKYIIEFSTSTSTIEYDITREQYSVLNSSNFSSYLVTLKDNCLVSEHFVVKFSKTSGTYKMTFNFYVVEIPIMVIDGKLIHLDSRTEINLTENYLLVPDREFYISDQYARENSITVYSINEFADYILNSKAEEMSQQTKEIEFWSSYGSAYSKYWDSIISKVEEKTGTDINHVSKGSFDKTLQQMIPAIVTNNIPNMVMGYPDDFAMYAADDVLLPLENYFTETELNDYIGDFMTENYFTQYGQKHLYGLPFSKSTEVLVYNGTFVNYCETRDPDLGIIPKTWDEWSTKGPKYMTIYDELIDGGKVLCGKQDVDGKTHGFVLADKSELFENDDGEQVFKSGHDGVIGLIDFSEIQDSKLNTRLLSWWSTDNAFITLCKQWGAEYTKLDLDKNNQGELSILEQKGDVLFGSVSNRNKVKEFLQLFADFSKQRIFGVPSQLNGFYDEPLKNGSAMFLICPAGYISYNANLWHYNLSFAPIPYKDADKKFVFSQGANIAITDKSNYKDCAKVLKALTTDDVQTQWCLSTGYYPCSYSALNNSKYISFMEEGEPDKISEYVYNWNLSHSDKITCENREKEVYSNPSRVAYREASKVNRNYYMKKTGSDSDWKNFVDDAFYGSSGVRNAVKGILSRVFKEFNADAVTLDKIIDDVLGSADINKQAVNIVK